MSRKKTTHNNYAECEADEKLQLAIGIDGFGYLVDHKIKQCSYCRYNK